MRRGALLGLLFLALFAARLCHVDILWIEECYPAAAALQILDGKLPYQDFWFDKPPLSAFLYVLWGGHEGIPLRLAGALFVTLVAWLAFRFAESMWSPREGVAAACLIAFALTFAIPSAVMALAPDLLMIAPHIGAVYLAWRGRPFWSGLVAGVALLIHTKGVFVLAACLLWQYRSAGWLLAGFAAPNLIVLAALPGYVDQVWRWGIIYSRDTFVADPVWEGVRRTLNWAGFHATLVLAAAWFWFRERDKRTFLWMAISLAAVAGGLRFFPRYYFQLLPVFVLAGARGLVLLGGRRAAAVCLLLLIPLVRFGPRYALLAKDVLMNRQHEWSDLALYYESRAAAQTINRLAQPGDTLFVWGYRPDVYVMTRLPAGTPFLDSQPLTGVIADRHLTSAEPSSPELARRNRQRLTQTAPTFLVEGLGRYNPALSIDSYPDLKDWLGHYQPVNTAVRKRF